MSGENGLTITAANAVILLTIPGLYPVPQQLQGFAADNVYDVEDVENSEEVLGVDGRLSAGFVPYVVIQTFAIMPDSESSVVFENWLMAETSLKDKFYASGSTTLPAIGRSYQMNNGVLKRMKPLPGAKKVLEARMFQVKWESVVPLGLPV